MRSDRASVARSSVACCLVWLGGAVLLAALTSRGWRGCDAAATGSGVVTAQILEPPSGTSVYQGETVPVRIRVEAVGGADVSWSLSLRDVSSSSEQRLASGQGAANDLAAAALDEEYLASDQEYIVTLTATDGVAMASAETRVRRATLRYALIPLEEGNLSTSGYAIESGNASGDVVMYSGIEAVPAELVLYDRRTGRRDSVLADIYSNEGVVLSPDGLRISFYGHFAHVHETGLGYVDLSNKESVLLDRDGYLFYTTDATARRWAYQANAPDRETRQYFFLDEVTGDRRQLTDDPQAIRNSGFCPPFATVPLIDSDGSTIVILTSATLGLVPADIDVGCRVFSYDVAAASWRHVAGFPKMVTIDIPVLSGDGRWLSFLMTRSLPTGGSRSFAALMNVTTGEIRDVADVGPFTSFDSVITRDGRGVVISSQADLDPRVGNADHNVDLFYYDFATQSFSQISQTISGIGSRPGGCSSYRPFVSQDGGVVMFYFKRRSVDSCTLDGLQRNQRDGFAFRGVRAVRIRDGNRGPVFDPPGNPSVTAGELVTIALTALDPDGEPISFFAQAKDGTDVPSGSVITDHHDGTATFRWPTRLEDAGDHILRVAAFDEGGGEVFHDVTISVVPRIAAAGTATPTETVTPLATASATSTCPGDCDRSGGVSVSELVTGVNILLDTVPVATCPSFACSNPSASSVECLVRAVNAALHGCGL